MSKKNEIKKFCLFAFPFLASLVVWNKFSKKKSVLWNVNISVHYSIVVLNQKYVQPTNCVGKHFDRAGHVVIPPR